jgi:hypothetical protein
MLDTLLPLLLVALTLQVCLTRHFLASLRALDPGLFERFGRPNAFFFLLHGGPGDYHPFLEFLKRRDYDALPAGVPALRGHAGRLRVLYRVVSGLWIATIVSAALQVAAHLSR